MKETTKNICVICGGKSPEHSISLVSASNVVAVLKKIGYQVSAIGIEQQTGKWRYYQNGDFFSKEGTLDTAKLKDTGWQDLVIKTGLDNVFFINNDNNLTPIKYDIMFPVVHGENSEDGKLQGLLEHLGVKFVGCGTLASSMGMDKLISKMMASVNMIPIVPWLAYTKDSNVDLSLVKAKLNYPLFVKPVDSGSAIGVTKVYKESELFDALNCAYKYSKMALLEKAINAREIEFSVIGTWNKTVDVSLPGEIVPLKDFYNYNAKYIDQDGAKLVAPVELTNNTIVKMTKYAEIIYRSLRCSGLSRVDFFIDKVTDNIYFNEINTIPGFTSISMFPKLWEVSGIDAEMLLKKIITTTAEEK